MLQLFPMTCPLLIMCLQEDIRESESSSAREAGWMPQNRMGGRNRMSLMWGGRRLKWLYIYLLYVYKIDGLGHQLVCGIAAPSVPACLASGLDTYLSEECPVFCAKTSGNPVKRCSHNYPNKTTNLNLIVPCLIRVFAKPFTRDFEYLFLFEIHIWMNMASTFFHPYIIYIPFIGSNIWTWL